MVKSFKDREAKVKGALLVKARTIWASSTLKESVNEKVIQSCPTLCDPVDCSLPGSSVHGIFQARVLEWGAIAFSAFCSRRG